MSESRREFQEFLEREVSRVRGVAVPIHSGLLRRALVWKVPVRKLHPNPNDEFCMPEVGPNYDIIASYERHYRRLKDRNTSTAWVMANGRIEPLMVERIRPDGYMILNGHHRWAGALRAGRKSLPVSLANPVEEKEILRILDASAHDRRVALDLDEVVFARGDAPAEKKLPFPLSRLYRERLSLGIPALFRFLAVKGYDVWVYSAEYHSADYVRALFRMYHAPVTGVVTGTGRKAPEGVKAGKQLEEKIREKYDLTLHVDRDLVLRIDSRTKGMEEFPLVSGAADGWSGEIMDIVGKMA